MNAGPQMITEEQVQEDLLRLDAYRNQLNAMLQQLQMLANSRVEHIRARESLEGLERAPKDAELLVPVGGDTFFRGIPAPDSRVYLGIGSGVVVEMERPKVSELLAERLKRIEQASVELEGQVRSLEERVQQLSQRLEAISRGAGGEPGLTDDVGRD
ncbi:MAG: prefoldin subunit alpha [Thermoplasmata archaeon]|nr:prefoldin subunit alpha [Thermoplasmata archaeon]